jgi:PncC family amidohydrolase
MRAYQKLVKTLIEKKLTISTAESCTGGLISKLITDIPGASDVFLGSVVSYSNDMKKKWLDVRTTTLEQYGAVSEPTVQEMLDGIVRATGSNVAVAVSGIAGPTGGTPEKPVGTVFIGVAVRDQRIIKNFLFEGSRDEVRINSATKAAELILSLLDQNFS